MYFWLGGETSQDEAGTAAYKTVELDDLLGDEPVQYREVQGNESSLFLRLFKHMTVLPGGVATGFRKVTDEKWTPSLHSIVGDKKHVQMYDVTPMGVKALNNEDAFILDLEKDKIFVFVGDKASHGKKRQANAEVQTIKGSPGRGKAKDIRIDGLEDESKEYDPFWEWMGGKPDKLPDAEPQVIAEREMCMIKISDDSGKLKAEEIHKGSLQMDKMESDDAYILDTGISLYVWVGKTANKEEKKLAMQHVMQYMQDNKLPMHLPVCRVIEGKEPKHFTAMMEDCKDGKWDAAMMKGGYCGRKSSKAVKKDKK